MSEFYRRFLIEDPRRGRPDVPSGIFLGAFGKHPGWDDHVEDLGLETEALIYAKSLLYVQGIGGQIDSGAWEKLDPSSVLPAFKHLFLWQRGNQCLIGRMWSSSDGKGRTRYPMVVCLHMIGVSTQAALELALPLLGQIEEACLLTRSASEVRSILENARGALRAGRGEASQAGSAADTDSCASFVENASFGPRHEGWFRILYQLESQCGAFAPGRFSSRASAAELRPQHFRVPSPLLPGQGLLRWSQFFLSQLDPGVPLLFIAPLEENWVDVTLGEPTSHETFCLRAGLKALPLVTEVPYSLDDAFRERAGAVIESFRKNLGSECPPDSQDTAIFPRTPFSSAKRRVLKWFGGGDSLSN